MLKLLAKPFIVILIFIVLPFAGYCQLPVPQWVNNLGGSGDSKPTGLITDNQNNIYVTGYFSGTVDFDPSAGVKNLSSVGGYDIFVAKYTPAGALTWAVSMGGDGLDQANCMTVDNNGNATVVGQFQSSTLNAGAFSLQSQGAEDIFIIHLDANGNVNWAKSIGADQTDRGEEASADAQGNVTVTAIFQSTINVNGTSLTASGGQFNGLLLKYDVNGNLLWDMNLGNSGDTEVYGNGTDSNGNIIVSGLFTGSVDFDPLGTHNVLNSNGNEYFVAKYSPAGKLIWVTTGNGALVNNISIINIDSNNDIYFGGTFSFAITFGSTTLTPQGQQDVFLVKYSANGALQFAKDIGSNAGSLFEYQMRNDPNNNDIYLTGYFYGTVDFDPSAATANVTDHGQRDFYVAKYDPNGNYIWAFGGGSPNCDLSLGIELGVDKNSNVIAGGSFCSTVNFDPSNCTTNMVTAINSRSDTYIAKYTPSSSVVIANNILTAPLVKSICVSGDPVVIAASAPTGGSGIYTYQWQSSPDSLTFTDIQGATSITYDPPAITATTYYRRVVSSACAQPSNSNVIGIKIQPALANNTVTGPAVASFCGTGNSGVITGSAATGGSGTYVYQWQSSQDNVTFTDITGATSANYDPPAISVTTYYRRTVTSGSCTTPFASNAVKIIVTPNPAVPIPTAASVNICSGSSASLSVSSPQQGIIYNWYDSATKNNLLFTGSSYTTAILTSGRVYYIEAVNGSCTSISLVAVQVNVSALPAAPTVTNPVVSVCSGSSATLGISNPLAGITYKWYTASSGGPSVFTGNDFITPAVTSNTVYYAEAANTGGCASATRTAINVSISPLPLVSAQGASICPGTTATLTASSTDQNAVIKWYTAPSGGNPVFTGSAFTTPALNSNISYYAEATDNITGCASAARSAAQVQMIQPLAAPVVSVSATTTSSVTFAWDAVNGASGYQVSTDNGLTFSSPGSGSDGLTYTVSGLQAQQSVTLIARSVGGVSCQESANSLAVTGTAASPLGDQIFVANAFTPNNDGKNDIVYVHGPNIKSMKFYVYDQWGELLYTSFNQSNGWDGNYKGAKEPVGVYVYYVEAIMNDGKQVNKKGSITLLK